MSQFSLCSHFPQVVALHCRPIRPEESWLSDAAAAYFGAEPCVPMYGERELVLLLDDARKLMLEGDDFRDTPFFTALLQLLDVCEKAVFWWADYWDDLPVITDVASVTSHIAEQVREPMGEVYLQWCAGSRSDQMQATT